MTSNTVADKRKTGRSAASQRRATRQSRGQSALSPPDGASVPNALNPDAYAFMVLQGEYRDQMDRHARLREQERDLVSDLELVRAKALTAAERAASIMETLLKLEQPRDAEYAQ